VEAASAGFRDLSFPFCGSCPPLVLACKLVSQYKLTLAFSIKLGLMAFSLKKLSERKHGYRFCNGG
jgi:hypothetical protein